MGIVGLGGRARKLLLAAFGLVLGALAGESLLWSLDLPRLPQAKQLRHTGGLQLYGSKSIPYPMHRLIPHSTYTHVYSDNPRGYFDAGNAITVVANNRGFRGNDFTSARVPDGVRIVFLGDSLTLGEGVRFEDTYPEVIAADLSTGFNGRSRVESYNYGMLAYNTTQEYLLLLEEALFRKPDLVVLGYFINDADGPFAYLDPATGMATEAGYNPFEADARKRPPTGFPYNFRTAQLLWHFSQRRRSTATMLSYYHDLYGEKNPHLETNMESLRKIIRLCGEHDIPLVIACIPVLCKLDGQYPFRRLHAAVEQVVRSASSANTTYVDLLPAFEGKDPRGLWVHETDHHPNEAAHRIIARSLLGPIRDRLPAAQDVRSPGGD